MSDITHKVGILGVGHLIQHMIPALVKVTPASDILLSPRGSKRAVALQSRFGFDIAADNEDLIRRSETLIVAVRPHQIDEAMNALPWRHEQTVISVCAGVPISAFDKNLPGSKVIRTLPVTAAEFGASPTTVFPENELVSTLFAACGPLIALSSEAEFEAASVLGCFYGWNQALVGEIAKWLVENGMESETARKLANGMAQASITTINERPDSSIDSLVDELCPSGSYTGLGMGLLREQDAFTPWRQACDAVLKKFQDHKD